MACVTTPAEVKAIAEACIAAAGAGGGGADTFGVNSIADGTETDVNGNPVPAGSAISTDAAGNVICTSRQVEPDPVCDNDFKLNEFASADGKTDFGFVEKHYHFVRVAAYANNPYQTWAAADFAVNSSGVLDVASDGGNGELCLTTINPHCRLRQFSQIFVTIPDFSLLADGRGEDGWRVDFSLERSVAGGPWTRVLTKSVGGNIADEDTSGGEIFQHNLNTKDAEVSINPLTDREYCYRITYRVRKVGAGDFRFRFQNFKVTIIENTRRQ